MKILATLVLTALFAMPRAKVPSPQEQLARELLLNFAAGRFEVASIAFNDDLRPLMTPAVFAQVKQQMDSTAGKFQAITAVHHLSENGFPVIELIARFEKSQVAVQVVFDVENRVGAIHFKPILPPQVEPALEAMARELLANIVMGHFDEAGKHFDDTMRSQLPPPNLADLNKKILAAFGAFQSITEVRQRVEGSYRIIDIIASCDRMPLVFQVSFDAKNRVAALLVSPKVQPH